MSSAIFQEFVHVMMRPKTLRRFETTLTKVDAFLANLEAIADLHDDPTVDFHFRRDPTDTKYIELAIACGGQLIVTRDNDLLDLMLDTDDAGRRLRAAYPSFRVLTPPAFLDLIDADERE